MNSLENDVAAGFVFDFDTWAALAQGDPEEFARRRDLAVDAACESIGGRDKPGIAGICWRIELERRRSTSALQLCLKLSSLMWQRYSDLTGVLNEMDGPDGNRPAGSGQVIRISEHAPSAKKA